MKFYEQQKTGLHKSPFDLVRVVNGSYTHFSYIGNVCRKLIAD